MEQYFLNYASLEQQRWMVSDRQRTDAFAKAIGEMVKPGDVVIDVGAGTGILSILAAKAGARRVIAVERSDMADLARELIEKNELSDKIELFKGDANNLKIDEKADVVISEWLGHMAYVERMFHSVIQVRNAWLKPEGILLPSSVDVMMAPIDDQELYHEHGPAFWNKTNIHGIDFSCFVKRELQMGHANQNLIPNKVLLSHGKCIHHQKTIIANAGDEWGAETVEYRIERDGTLNGFVGWFSAELSPGVTLDTSPRCPRTHWEQTHFPFYPIDVEAGQTLRAEFYMDEIENSRLMEMTIRVDLHEIKYVVN